MKKNNSNSQEKNRNNTNNTNNHKSKTGRDTTITPNHILKDCAGNRCKAASSCSSTNKTVQEIERYTKEAESLVEALSALTKLAEQLKPCIAAKSQCSPCGSDYIESSSDASSYEQVRQENNEQDSDSIILDARNRKVTEEPKVVSKVRSEPVRVRTEETTDQCLCCCSSLSKAVEKQSNKLTFEDDQRNGKSKKDRDSDDERSSCCHKKKSKVHNEIIELKPLPMPKMTVVYPEEEPKREILRPTRQANDAQESFAIIPDKVTVYPTVPATTTKAAMNLVDKEMQTDGACQQCEMGCNTDPAQFMGGKAGKEVCSVCCQVGCGLDDSYDGENRRQAITLNTSPFEDYAEKGFSQYRHDDVHCKCPTAEATKKSLLPQPPRNTPEQQKAPPEDQQEQAYPQLPPPSSMTDCYPYCNPNQPLDYSGGQGLQYQHFPHQMTQSNQVEYTEYRIMSPKPQRPMNSDSIPIGIINANFEPPGGIVYKACRTKGSAMDTQKMRGFEGIDCIPNCLSTETSNRVYGKIQSSTSSNVQSNISQSDYRNENNGTNTGKKAVQYQNQRQYDNYYSAQPQQQNFKNQPQQIQYINDKFAPCQFENIAQRRDMMRRTQESYPNNRNMYGQQAGMQRDVYQKQFNSLVGQHYNTLFVGKADKDMEQSMKSRGRPSPNNAGANADKSDECSGGCKYKNQKK